jgi:uncharacterized delta-60 repeat protein
LSAGGLDTTFGSGGLVSGPIGAPYSTTGYTLYQDSWYHVPVVVYPNTGMHPDTDNKVLAGGFILDPVTKYQDFAVARYNPDGSLDTSFGTNGVAYTSVGVTSSDLFGLAIEPNDRKIVAVGAAAYQHLVRHGSVNDDEAVAVVRFNLDGSLDSTFNPSGTKPGTVVTNVSLASTSGGLPGVDFANTVAIDNSGRIVVGASSYPSSSGYDRYTLLRYTSSGALDPAFGKNGIVITSNFQNSGDDPGALAIQPDGNILLAGNGGLTGMAVARYSGVNGSLDKNFNATGIVSGLMPSGYRESDAFGVVAQNSTQDPNGFKIVLAGTSYDASGTANLTMTRVSSTGHLDTTYGGANTGFYNNTAPGASAFSMVQAADGDLLAAGSYQVSLTDATRLFGVAAFLPNGTPDASFGTSGVATAGVAGRWARGRGIALQSDGKVVLAGFTGSSSSATDYTLGLARFSPPATKITSFTLYPNSVTAGAIITLTVSGILNSNPTSTITGIVFYLDTVGGTPLTVPLLGNTGGAWSYSFDTTGLTSGTHTLYAEAVDSNGVFSDPVAVSIQVS